MGIELAATKTLVEPGTLRELLAGAWINLFPQSPKKESLLILLAQWALETGHGKSVWNYNLGNVKATSSGAYDYCYFACNEVLPTEDAKRYQDKSPSTAKITKRGEDKCVVWFYPKHAACCFRAFATIESGVIDYLSLMSRRFSSAWPFVLKADPVGFCHALKMARYYTADEDEYIRSVSSIFRMYCTKFNGIPLATQKTTPIDWAGALSFPASPVLTPDVLDESPIYSPYSVQLQEQEMLQL